MNAAHRTAPAPNSLLPQPDILCKTSRTASSAIRKYGRRVVTKNRLMSTVLTFLFSHKNGMQHRMNPGMLQICHKLRMSRKRDIEHMESSKVRCYFCSGKNIEDVWRVDYDKLVGNSTAGLVRLTTGERVCKSENRWVAGQGQKGFERIW